jgi:hypothetical protein
MTNHITLVIFCSLLSIQSVIINTEGINFSKLLASQTKLEFFDFMDTRLELKRFILMKIQDCEKRIHDADNIDQLMNKLYQMIREHQECYKKAVEEAYKQNSLSKKRDSDISQIFDLVEHSIVVGNYELLEQYLLNPISKNELSISPKIIFDIDGLIETAKTPIEKSYFQWTKEELKKVL